MADKPTSSSFRDAVETLSLRPPVPGGVDLFTSAALLAPGFLRQSENVRLMAGVLARRPGDIKLYRASNPCGSKTFGTTGKYATIAAAPQLLIPYGGFAFRFSIAATRGGTDGQLIHGQDGADSDPPFDISLSNLGVLVAKVNWDGGGSASVSTGVLADGSVQHGLFVYDSPSGTVTLYLNNVSVGTPVNGLSAKRPVQTANMSWLVVAKKTAAAVVSMPFAGRVDALALFSLAGARPASGDTTFIAALLKHSRRQWPLPQLDAVRFNYDMDAAGAVMKDSSLYKNDAVVTGTPTDSAEVAFSSIPSNFIGCFDANDGSRVNVFASAGRLFYQRVRE